VVAVDFFVININNTEAFKMSEVKEQTLLSLVKESKKIEQLLIDINRKAMDEGSCDYGLPLSNDNAKDALELIVLKWVANL